MNNLILVMTINGMMIIGKTDDLDSAAGGITISEPRVIMLNQAPQGTQVSIQNVPFMFSKKIFLHSNTIIAEASDGWIDINIKKAYIESVSAIRIASQVDIKPMDGKRA